MFIASFVSTYSQACMLERQHASWEGPLGRSTPGSAVLPSLKSAITHYSDTMYHMLSSQVSYDDV